MISAVCDPLADVHPLCFAFAQRWWEHPAHLTAEPAAPSRGDTGFSSRIRCKLNMFSETHLPHQFGPSAICCVRSLAWLSSAVFS